MLAQHIPARGFLGPVDGASCVIAGPAAARAGVSTDCEG